MKKYCVMAELAPALTLRAKFSRSWRDERACGWYSGYAATSMWKVSFISLRMNSTSSLAKRNSPISPMPEGMSPRSATMRRMPCSRYVSRMARMLSRDEPTHDRCGAASMPSRWISTTASSVPCCVVPPAPKVTEMKRGLRG